MRALGSMSARDDAWMLAAATRARYRSRIARLAVLAAVLVTLVGALPRVALAAGVLPDALRPFIWSDVLHIWERGARDGQLPYRDVFFEYPPLVGYLWAGIETVARSAAASVALWALVQAAAAGAVAALLAREAGPRRTLVYWSLAPQLVLYGSLNFETLALAPLVAAVALARHGRVRGSAVALGIGTAVKLFPAAVLPVVVLAPTTRRRAALAAVFLFGAVASAPFVPGIAAPFSTLGTLGRYSVGIEPNLDSVWGLLRDALRGAGADPLAAIVAVTLAGTLATYALVVVPAARRSTDPSAAAGLAVAVVLVWSRLYSPQYSLWLLPFFALAALPLRTFALLTVADALVFLTVYPLTLVGRGPGDGGAALLAAALGGAVVLRHAALILSARELWRRATRSREPRRDPRSTGR